MGLGHTSPRLRTAIAVFLLTSKKVFSQKSGFWPPVRNLRNRVFWGFYDCSEVLSQKPGFWPTHYPMAIALSDTEVN